MKRWGPGARRLSFQSSSAAGKVAHGKVIYKLNGSSMENMKNIMENIENPS
jgi:hypothetical protein